MTDLAMNDLGLNDTELSADYLVVGAGAMGMAFVDTLLTETDASIVMVDRRDKPGGHWNTAYPFVRLHQPSSFYGVNSVVLGSDRIDDRGGNEGLYELASGNEIVSYFDQIMTRRFMPSGRVQFYPNCNYIGESRFSSAVSGEAYAVTSNHKVVDATYMNVSVPSMRPPSYDVADDAICIPVNDLPKHATVDRDYVVVGGGKTAMDAVLWLLTNGCDPSAIRWIRPRDSWLLDRALIQPGHQFADNNLRFTLDPLKAAVAATSIDDLFDHLERAGSLMRLDDSVKPTMYRCATVTRAELDQLRRVDHVIRLGRVSAISTDEIVLADGTIPTTASTIHVDCSADGLAHRRAVPVFAGDTITLQAVRTCQQVFSAAFLGHLETAYATDDEKNALSTPVPHPNTDLDWLRTQMQSGINSFLWRQDEALNQWLTDARLDPFSVIRTVLGQSTDGDEAIEMIGELGPQALASLQQLLASTESN